MTRYGYIVANSRPSGADIYLDGQPLYDPIGSIVRTPTLISNISEGSHIVTFRKLGFNDITVTIDVIEGIYSDVGAMLNTTQLMRYPMMLSLDEQNPYIDDLQIELYLDILQQSSRLSSEHLQQLQPAPGWPAIPTPSGPYGHIVANTIPDGAEVYLDGQPVYDSMGLVTKTPVTILGISTGVHRVTFRKQGYFDENVNVLIQNGLYSDASAVLRLRMAPMNSSNISPPLKWYMEPDYMQFAKSVQHYYLQTSLQPRQRGIVHFDTSPHGAIIMVDGQYIVDPDTEEYIRTPANILLFEGRRDFVLKLEGHHDISGYVDIFAGSRVDIFRNLEPIPGSNIRSMPYPYYPGYSEILIDSQPQGAYIYIDGYPMTDSMGNAILTPVRITGVMEGLHEVRIAKDGYYEKQLIINVISGQTSNAYAKLQPIYG